MTSSGALAREFRAYEGDAVLVLERELGAIDGPLRQRLNQRLAVLAESEERRCRPTGEVQEHERRERSGRRERGAAEENHEPGGETDGDRGHDDFHSDLSGEPLAPRKRLVEHFEGGIVDGVLERLVEALVSDGEPEDARGNRNRGDGEDGERAEEVGGRKHQEAHQDSESIEEAARDEHADGEVDQLRDAREDAEEAGQRFDLVPASLHLGEEREVDEVLSEDGEERQNEDRFQVGARPGGANHPALADSSGVGLLAAAASHVRETNGGRGPGRPGRPRGRRRRSRGDSRPREPAPGAAPRTSQQLAPPPRPSPPARRAASTASRRRASPRPPSTPDR